MFNTLRDNPGARKKPKLLGRGIGSGLGKTSGRGGKGQTARSGVAIKGFEGGQMPLYRRLPKRGFTSLDKIRYQVINISDLQSLVNDKKIESNVTIEDLRKFGLLKGHDAKIKLLGSGSINKALNVEVHAASKSAKDAIANAGGSLVLS